MKKIVCSICLILMFVGFYFLKAQGKKKEFSTQMVSMNGYSWTGDFKRAIEYGRKKNTAKNKENLPVLKGPYLGQQPPSLIPEVFASRVLTKEGWLQCCSGFMKQGTIFIYSPITPDIDWKYKTTYFMQLRAGGGQNLKSCLLMKSFPIILPLLPTARPCFSHLVDLRMIPRFS